MRKQLFKKLEIIILVVCLMVCVLPKNVYASNTSIRLREYEKIIEALNTEFGLEMSLLNGMKKL